MAENIYRFKYESPYGDITSIFTAKPSEVEALIERGIDLGEVLGKHSSLIFEPDELSENIELVTDDQNAVIIFNNYNMQTGIDLIHLFQLREEEYE